VQGAKPWRYTGEEANMDREEIKKLVKMWWDLYNDVTLDYNYNGASDEADVAVPELKYSQAPSAA
jgi:inositol 3-alpha-galactosyltransferase